MPDEKLPLLQSSAENNTENEPFISFSAKYARPKLVGSLTMSWYLSSPFDSRDDEGLHKRSDSSESVFNDVTGNGAGQLTRLNGSDDDLSLKLLSVTHKEVNRPIS